MNSSGRSSCGKWPAARSTRSYGRAHVLLAAVDGAGQHHRVELAVDLQHAALDRCLHERHVRQAVGTDRRPHAPAVVLHGGVRRGPAQERRPVGLGRGVVEPLVVLRPRGHQVAHALAVVGGQRPLRRERHLEADGVAHRGPLVAVAHDGPAQLARVRHRHGDDGPDDLGLEHRGRPGHQAAPAVPDDHRLGHAQRADDAGDVGRQGARVVALGRVVGAAVAAQVHRDRAVAGVGEGGQLLPPRPPEGREAVQEQDGRSVADVDDVEARPVGRDVPVGPGPGGPDGRVGLGQGHVAR